MSQLALADYLTDFGGPPALARLVDIIAPQPAPMPMAPPAPDIDGLVAAEVAKVEIRLRGEMGDAAEAALSVERARHELQVAEMETAFGAEVAVKIATAVEAAESRLISVATGAAARILSSMLSDDLARRSVEQLAAQIRAAIGDRDTVRVRISGPQSMLESLGTALGPLAERCDFGEGPGFDMTVAIDDALFETRLAEWSAQIGGTIS